MKIDNAIDYLQAQCNEEYEREARELRHYDRSLRIVSDKVWRMEETFYRHQKQTPALLKAIQAVELYIEKSQKNERTCRNKNPSSQSFSQMVPRTSGPVKNSDL